jgi:8-oxo-dGTP diphosphatase
LSAPAPGRRAFSVAVFCRHRGEVLLVRHRRLGTWLPVGGEIEPGETPLEAARRELREETGLAGEFPSGLGVDGTPSGLIGYEEHPAGAKGLHLNFAFVADVASRELAPCDEWSEARWVASAQGMECPRNVKELVDIALAAPRGKGTSA